VLAILTVTTEWTQRTGLVTYTVEPSRLRVTLAKLVAVVALGLVAVTVALVVAALANVVGAAFLTAPAPGTSRRPTPATWCSCSWWPCCRASPSGCCS
jgi:hypothetical protein